MSRYNQKSVTPKKTHVMVTTAKPTTKTFEGASGYTRDAKTELFLRATGAFAGKSTFYEDGGVRDERMLELTEQLAVTADGWAWLCGFLPWLRGEGNMRTAPLMIATEAVRARLDRNIASPGWLAKPGVTRTESQKRAVDTSARAMTHRQLLASVMQRADEPGEMLAYWHSVHGRKIPQPVKRAVADAATRLYTERSVLKYDTASHGIRFADVLELTHAKPRRPETLILRSDETIIDALERDNCWQGDLFKHIIDRRHGNDAETPATLRMISANRSLRQHVALGMPELLLDQETLQSGGMTWEDALSLAGPKVPKDKLWEAMIPSMGYMALLRNLRNFDEAGISNAVARKVANRIADPEQVAKSRQLPFRFFSAYKNVTSLRWGQALEEALEHSLTNVPSLGGRTLILVDRSPSMFPGYFFSIKNTSEISLADQAAVFGAALALRAVNPTLVEFGGQSKVVAVPKGGSVLKLVGAFGQSDGTDIPSAVKQHFAGHDRVIVVTDEQTKPGWFPSNMADYRGMGETQIDDLVPKNVPVYMWNMAGYKAGATPSGVSNRYTMGGLSDAAFRMVAQLEALGASTWPWESISPA